MPGSKISQLLKTASAGLTAILKDGELGGYGAGSAGGQPAGHPGGAPVAAPAAAPPAVPPGPKHVGGVSPKGVMMDVHQRLAAAMDKLDDAGAAPGDLQNEVKQLAGLLMAIATDAAEAAEAGAPGATPPAAAAPPGAPPPAAPHPPPPHGAPPPHMPPKFARFVAVEKATLDGYTAFTNTVSAAQSRIWRAMDELLPEDKDACLAEIKAAAEMLRNAPDPGQTGSTSETKAMKTLKFDPVSFTKFMAAQLEKAAKDQPDVLAKRTAMLTKATAIAKESWVGTDKVPSEISVEVEEAFVGSADGNGVGGASAQDLTTKADQEVKDGKIQSADSGSPGAGNPAFENPAADAKSNAAEGASNNGGTNLPSSNASQDNAFAENLGKTGAQDLSKLISDLQDVAKVAQHQTVVQKRNEANPWVPDLNTPAFLEEGDPAKVQKRATESLDWGKDPDYLGHR